MDSQPPNSSQPPSAKPQLPPASVPPHSQAGYPRPAPRRYPKPPPLLTRLILLCLRPESWAETARYPTHVTLLPLLLAILLSAVAIAAGVTTRAYAGVQAFATTYDDCGYPPVELTSDATLMVKGSLASPIRIFIPRFPVYIDPTGGTTAESTKVDGWGLFVSARQVTLLAGEGPTLQLPLDGTMKMLNIDLPAKGTSKPFSGNAIKSCINNRIFLFYFFGFVWFIGQAFFDALWSLMMTYLLSTMIMQIVAGPRDPEGPDRRFLLPRRAAIRMAAGLIVPVILLGGLMQAFGHPLQSVFHQFTFLFLVLLCMTLAIWTALLARRMYAPQPARRR